MLVWKDTTYIPSFEAIFCGVRFSSLSRFYELGHFKIPSSYCRIFLIELHLRFAKNSRVITSLEDQYRNFRAHIWPPKPLHPRRVEPFTKHIQAMHPSNLQLGYNRALRDMPANSVRGGGTSKNCPFKIQSAHSCW